VFIISGLYSGQFGRTRYSTKPGIYNVQIVESNCTGTNRHSSLSTTSFVVICSIDVVSIVDPTASPSSKRRKVDLDVIFTQFAGERADGSKLLALRNSSRNFEQQKLAIQQAFPTYSTTIPTVDFLYSEEKEVIFEDTLFN
jgi:hypothetical protein